LLSLICTRLSVLSSCSSIPQCFNDFSISFGCGKCVRRAMLSFVESTKSSHTLFVYSKLAYFLKRWASCSNFLAWSSAFTSDIWGFLASCFWVNSKSCSRWILNSGMLLSVIVYNN
jgi:hypothetical protein